MPGRKVNRREVIGRAGVIGAGGLLPALPVAGTGQREEPSPVPDTPISLDLVGGDVWAWSREITGTCPGVAAGAVIEVVANGVRTEADRDGDRFGAIVRLQPGENEVRATAAASDGSTASTESVMYTVRLHPRPTARVDVRTEGDRIVFDGSGSEASGFDASPIVTWRWSERESNPEPLSGAESGARPLASPEARIGSEAILTVPAPRSDGEYFVSLEITGEAGRTDTSTSLVVVEGGVARVPDPVVEEAAWVESAVVYGMVVRNFTSGGFRGVTERMDELASLGVTALWFAPITRTIRDYFGYEVTDYFDVRPEYGTLDDFRALVDAAHARGMRVLLDFVPNHTSIEHPYFEHSQEFGEASPYFDYYDRNDGGGYTYYFEWSHLPNLNFDNPEVRRFMTEAFTFWVREYGVDGFRADVAWGIKERRPDYWLEWSAEINRIKPDALLIAEASARDPFYVENGFDAAYDWTDDLGVWAWGDVFALGFPMSMAMTDALTNNGEGYHPDSLVFRFLNNNDTDMRFVSVYGVDRYRMALAMLMTLPGIPCIYTGDEVGAAFLPYETTWEIGWDDPNELRQFVQHLVRMRRENPALYSRQWSQVVAEPAVEVFAYLRGDEDHEQVLVVVNYSANDVEADIPLPAVLAATALEDVWSGEQIDGPRSEALKISMPAWSFVALKHAG